MPISTTDTQPIIVLGLGVIGLTTSIRLIEAGYAVIAYASHLPEDPLSLTSCYTSAAAGAHHLSFATDADIRQQKLDKRTFDVFAEEEQAGNGGLRKIKQVEFYGKGAGTHIKFFESLPDFKLLPKDDIPSYAEHAVSFTSYTINPEVYIPQLLSKFLGLGGRYFRKTVSSLEEAVISSPKQPLAIVNCTGLGAKALGDPDMYPVRGQVVVVNAPYVSEGRTLQEGRLDDAAGEGGQRTYAIPRSSGHVVLGGTREVDDWDLCPRPETTKDILRRGLILYPELCPPEKRVLDGPPPQDCLNDLIVHEIVGLRPARRGGLRLERGDDIVLSAPNVGWGSEAEVPAHVPMVYNIGHAGAGWQCSWGCAEEVVEIIKEIIV